MDEFRRFAAAVSYWAGHPFVFSGAVALLIIWGALGPAMNYSTAWFYLLFLPTGIDFSDDLYHRQYAKSG